MNTLSIICEFLLLHRINEHGTLRTLNSISNFNIDDLDLDDIDSFRSDTSVTLSRDILQSQPDTPQSDIGNSHALMRSKTDLFQLTPTGGMFKATTDPNVSIYFPVRSISQTVTIAMQVQILFQVT